jgi:DNA repair protein RecN (Recombination protein N)
MLTLLKIRNLALVDELAWELGSGLISVTGETGAGKSVIVGALKMILGERADKGLIRTGEDTCTIESVFDLKDAADINAILEEGGLPPCDDTQIIIRRSIGNTANRQFINDSPVTLALLKKVGERLVDLHGPHDHQSLLSQERQLGMLDAFAANDPTLTAYRAAYRSWREKSQELEEIQNASDASEQELELLRHQLGEIQAAKLTAAVHIGKRAFYDQLGLPLDQAYARTGATMVENMLWRDTDEGINAFLQKRKPDWAD